MNLPMQVAYPAPAFTQEQLRPVFIMLLIVLSVFALRSLWQLSATGWRERQSISWQMTTRVLGYLILVLPALATLAALVIGWWIGGLANNPIPIFARVRVLESILPLAVGLQAAFLFSPDDEPGLEVVMACPRPLSFLLLERLGVLLFIQTAIGTVFMAFTLPVTGEALSVALLRWTAPMLLFAGVGIFITLRSRNALFGMLMVGCLWAALALFPNMFMPGYPMIYPLNYVQPFGWGIHPYIQPTMLSDSDYLLNRALVAGIGIGLLTLSVYEMRHLEKLLLGNSHMSILRVEKGTAV